MFMNNEVVWIIMGLLDKILNRWLFPCHDCGKKEKCKQKTLECDNYESK